MKYVYVPVYARNVYFLPRAEDKFNDLLSQASNPNVKKWIKSNFRNWLINKAELKLLPKMMLNGKNVPQWVKDKYGTEEIYVAGDATVASIDGIRLRDIIQFLNSLKQNVSNMSVEQVVKQTRQWQEKQQEEESKKAKEVDKRDLKIVHVYPNGFRWVENFGQQSLIREGELMQNCLKESRHQWFEKVSSNKTKIFSLRDNKNEPHISIEFSVPKKKIIQIKGKQNGPAVAKYIPYLQDFLFKNYIKYIDIDEEDLISNGFILLDGKLYSINDLPDGATVKASTGTTYLSSDYIDRLPNNFTVNNNLYISAQNLIKLPSNLVVKGNLTIGDSSITELPDDLSVKGSIILYDDKIKIPSSIKNKIIYQ